MANLEDTMLAKNWSQPLWKRPHLSQCWFSDIFLKSFKPNREKGLDVNVVFTSVRSLRKPPILAGGISIYSLDADPQKKDCSKFIFLFR